MIIMSGCLKAKAVFILLSALLVLGPADGLAKTLVILTTNDLHGQVEPLVSRGPAGTPVTLGGFSRLAGAVQSVRTQHPGRVLFVNCGDSLTGKYPLHFKGRAIFSVLSVLKPDAVTLGNHEFDHGQSILASALKHLRAPLVVSNLSVEPQSPLKNAWQSKKVVERNGLRIGLLGLMTAELPQISMGARQTAVGDAVTAAHTVAGELRRRDKVDLVVALTHLGLAEDRRLAEQVPEIDVICGGHSHDLMKKGRPIIVERPQGRVCIIVQAGARGTHLGFLKLEVQNDCITDHLWKPLKLDSAVAVGLDTERLIRGFQDQLPPPRILTTLEKPLNCRTAVVRTREAAVGNLVADILRLRFKTDVAFQNGGGLRGDRIIPAGPLTTADLDLLLPFNDWIAIMELTGHTLRQVLEQSVNRWPEAYGGFLQVSGLQYDLVPGKTASSPASHGSINRVSGIRILAKNGIWQPLQPEKTYTLAVNSFIASGGDGYQMLETIQPKSVRPITLRSAVIDYLQNNPEIRPPLENRITISTTN